MAAVRAVRGKGPRACIADDMAFAGLRARAGKMHLRPLALGDARPYYGAMGFLPPPSGPTAAFADLRAFFSSRRHHLGFAVLSLCIPGYFISLFAIKTTEKVYKPPEVIFVEKIDPNRSEAEIRRDLIAHTAKVRARQAEEKRLEEERRRQFKQLEKTLDAWGI